MEFIVNGMLITVDPKVANNYPVVYPVAAWKEGCINNKGVSTGLSMSYDVTAMRVGIRSSNDIAASIFLLI